MPKDELYIAMNGVKVGIWRKLNNGGSEFQGC